MNRFLSDLGSRNRDRRQLWITQLSDPDIITTYNGNISWNLKSGASQLPHGAKGHQIVRSDDCRRTMFASQELPHRSLPALEFEISFVDDRFGMKRRLVLLHGPQKGFATDLGGLELIRAADERNLAVD